jgi:hypothetical protein
LSSFRATGDHLLLLFIQPYIFKEIIHSLIMEERIIWTEHYTGKTADKAPSVYSGSTTPCKLSCNLIQIQPMTQSKTDDNLIPRKLHPSMIRPTITQSLSITGHFSPNHHLKVMIHFEMFEIPPTLSSLD